MARLSRSSIIINNIIYDILRRDLLKKVEFILQDYPIALATGICIWQLFSKPACCSDVVLPVKITFWVTNIGLLTSMYST
jgi:hypothetical protein